MERGLPDGIGNQREYNYVLAPVKQGQVSPGSSRIEEKAKLIFLDF